MYVCVCVTVHKTVECVQIMRWWSSNLVQGILRRLGSVANGYVLVYLTRPSHSSRLLVSFQGGHPPPAPTKNNTNMSPHRIILPHGINMSPSQHTDASHHDPTPRCPWYPPPTLTRSRHAYRIPVAAAPLLLPKLLPLWPSYVTLLPSESTTAPGVSPLLRTLSLAHTHQKQAWWPPTPPLLPVASPHKSLARVNCVLGYVILRIFLKLVEKFVCPFHGARKWDST